MIEEMDDGRLAEFVAAVWRRQGWQTRTMTEAGAEFVAVRREEPEPERGLIWVVADPEGPIDESDLRGFLEFCEGKGMDEGAVVTTGTFAPDATQFAAQEEVGLLDGDQLQAVIPSHGLTDLAEKYGGDPDDEARSSSSEKSAGALDTLESRVGALPVSGRLVVTALVVVGVLVAGALVGPAALPFVGGDDGSPVEPVTASTFSPEGAETTLLVSWDATRRDVIDPDPEDDSAYYPREGRTFVLVKLRLTNAGGAAVPVSQADFLLEANGTRYGHQPLAGSSSFEGRELVPGDTYGGWTVFSVPENAPGGTLVVDERLFAHRNATVQFSRDEELDVSVAN